MPKRGGGAGQIDGGFPNCAKGDVAGDVHEMEPWCEKKLGWKDW